MIDTNQINTILQIPLIAAFIWYSITLIRIFQTSQEKRDKEYLSALNKITEALNCLEQTLIKTKPSPTKPHRAE